MSETFEDIPAEVGTNDFQTSPIENNFNVSFVAPPARPGSPDLPQLPIQAQSSGEMHDEPDITGIEQHDDDTPGPSSVAALAPQPQEMQIAISPVINEFKPLESTQSETKVESEGAWNNDFAAFPASESKEQTPSADFGDFHEPAAAPASSAKSLTVKAEEWAEFHSPAPVAPASPIAASFPEALKLIQAGDLQKLGDLFKNSFPYSGRLEDAIHSEVGVDDVIKQNMAALPEVGQNLAHQFPNSADVLKIYEKENFKWDQSFVETYMFRSMGIAYPSERLTSSVFEVKTSLHHRTSLVAFNQDNLNELKEFDDKSELPDFKSSVNQDSLGVDANPLDLKERFAPSPHLTKMNSMDILREVIEDYAETNRRSTEAKDDEEQKLQELLGTNSRIV